MARRGRRYDGEAKLNIKKVIAVIIVFLLIIAFIIGMKNLLSNGSNRLAKKIENVNYYTIYSGNKWGVVNSYGDIVVNPEYDEMIVIPDSAKDIFVCTYDVNYSTGEYKTKVINSKNKEIITGFDKIDPIINYDQDNNVCYEKDVFLVQKDGKYGLINYSGKEILACEYSSIKPIYGIENSLVYEKDGKFGLCDNLGNIIIEPNYKDIQRIGYDYKNGYIVVNDQEKSGVIGFDKEKILEEKYDEIKPISGENIYAVKENDKYIVINKDGEKIIENSFEDITEIDRNCIIAVQDGKYGAVDLNGQTKIDFEYDELKYTNNDNLIAKQNDKYGIISLEKEEKLPIDSKKITYVSSGDFVIAEYEENEQTISKIYNSNYEEKIQAEKLEINTLKGYIRSYYNNDYKYYNFKFEEKNASELFTSNNLFVSKKDGKYGFVDNNGKVVVDYIYDDATEQNSSGYAGIKKDGLWGAIDLEGNIAVEPKYDLSSNDKIDFIGKWHLCEDTNANYYIDN